MVLATLDEGIGQTANVVVFDSLQRESATCLDDLRVRAVTRARADTVVQTDEREYIGMFAKSFKTLHFVVRKVTSVSC